MCRRGLAEGVQELPGDTGNQAGMAGAMLAETVQANTLQDSERGQQDQGQPPAARMGSSTAAVCSNIDSSADSQLHRSPLRVLRVTRIGGNPLIRCTGSTATLGLLCIA
jgi:hypothetical protein